MTSYFSRKMNCDSLWRPWYIILVTCLQVFILYTGITRYLAFKEHFFNPKYGGNWNAEVMNFYLAMLITAGFFDCLAIYATFATTGQGDQEAEEVRDAGASLGQRLVFTPPPWVMLPQASQADGSSAGLYATAYGRGGNLSAGLVGGAAVGGGVVGVDEECLGGVPPFDTWSARSASQQRPPSDFPASYPTMAPPAAAMYRSVISNNGVIDGGGHKKRGLPAALLGVWRRFKRRFIPVANLMHILSAYAFFVALPILDAQKIHHYALPAGKYTAKCSI